MFNSDNLSIWQAGKQTLYTYSTNDPIATVTADYYFQNPWIHIGDVINVATEVDGTPQITILYVTDTDKELGQKTINFSDIYLLADGTRALTGNWNAGAYEITIGGVGTEHTFIMNQAGGGDCKIDLSYVNYLTWDFPEIVPRTNTIADGSFDSSVNNIGAQDGIYVRGVNKINPTHGLFSADFSISAVMTLDSTNTILTCANSQWKFTGNAPSSPTGNSGERWGEGAVAGNFSTSVGNGATCNFTSEVAVGRNAVCSGGSGTAIGSAATAGYQGSAFGRNTTASTVGTLAMGIGASATGAGASALGWNTNATQNGSFAMGALTQCTGASSVALCYVGSVTGSNSVGVGAFATVAHNSAIGMGAFAVTTKTNQFLSGSSSYPIVEFLIGNGATNASPQAQTLFTVTSGSGTDIAATDFVIEPGAGTGTGAGGSFIVRTATPGASGSTLNTFTAALTIDDQQKVLFSGEVEIDGDLNHDGSNIGFYGVAPVARPAAYTQTYATALRTHAARTAPGAGAGSGADATTFSGAECDALVADQQNTAQVLNQLIDDLQAVGLIQ